MYSKITNPETGRKVNIRGIIGRRVIQNYLQEVLRFQKGGTSGVLTRTFRITDKTGKGFFIHINNWSVLQTPLFKRKIIEIYRKCFHYSKFKPMNIINYFNDSNTFSYLITDLTNLLPIGLCFVRGGDPNIMSGAALVHSVCISKKFSGRG